MAGSEAAPNLTVFTTHCGNTLDLGHIRSNTDQVITPNIASQMKRPLLWVRFSSVSPRPVSGNPDFSSIVATGTGRYHFLVRTSGASDLLLHFHQQSDDLIADWAHLAELLLGANSIS